MPNITLTINQLLRHGLTGGFILLVLHILAKTQPCHPLLKHFLRWPEEIGPTAPVLFALAGGAVAYCLHRALVYPVLHRLLVLSVPSLRREAGASWWHRLWPWRSTTPELRLSVARMKMQDQQHLRFSGWASEIHFLYVAVQVLGVSVWYPGWPVERFGKTLGTLGIAAVLGTVFGWDRALLKIENRLSPRPGTPA